MIEKARRTRRTEEYAEKIRGPRSGIPRAIFSDEGPPQIPIKRALRERTKELDCLYGIMRLVHRYRHSLDKFLNGVVHILPCAWQYPEITCARIAFHDRTYLSDRCDRPGSAPSSARTGRSSAVTMWRQSAAIRVQDEQVGEVSIRYLEARPPRDEGPFFREERSLLDAVATQIGMNATRIFSEHEVLDANRRLIVERNALAEANNALRTVLAGIEDEKSTIRRDVEANVEKILLPILHAAIAEVSLPQRYYLELLEKNFGEIASPYVNRLAQKVQSLTPTEIAISNMIRGGLKTKEIARIRGLSPATVNRHREHIRRKLGVTNTGTNLATFLQTSV